MTTFSLKLPDGLDQRLRQAAKRRHTTRSAVLREAAERYLNEYPVQQQSCLELAEDICGCVEGPADLSSNKDHLKGFGD